MKRQIIFALTVTLFLSAVLAPAVTTPTRKTSAVTKNTSTKLPVKLTPTKNTSSKPFVVATPPSKVAGKPPVKTSNSSCKTTAKSAPNKITPQEA